MLFRTHSTASRARSTTQPRGGADERGSAAVEFAMISVLLAAIFFVVLQVGIYLYQRSIVASSTLAGARYAANANVSTADGAARAQTLLAQALSDAAAADITCTSTSEVGDGGLQLVVVRCTGSLPSLVTVLGSMLPVSAEASAIEEGQ